MSKETKIKREKPFQYLKRREDNSAFTDEIVNNWYIARAYVLDKLKGVHFSSGENRHLHVILEGDSPLMLAVARQVALSAHYINFVEYDQFDQLVCRNRTVITLVSQKEAQELISELNKEENLGNLLAYCKYTVGGKTVNADSYIDLELNIVKTTEDEDSIRLTEKDVKAYVKEKDEKDIFSIDTRKAIYAGKAYDLGSVIDNLPYEGLNDAERYNRALATFQSRVLNNPRPETLVDEKDNLTKVKEHLSNLMCADCFESRKASVAAQCANYDELGRKKQMALWKQFNEALSLSEHSRWVVEKLIMGYKPMSPEQRSTYQSLFKKQRKAYRDELKYNSTAPVHLNLCSYRELRRVDPDNMKYDSFLMLAIPLILGSIPKNESK